MLTVAMPVFWLWPTPPSTARTMRMYSDLVSRSSREVVVISPAIREGDPGATTWKESGSLNHHVEDCPPNTALDCFHPAQHLVESRPPLIGIKPSAPSWTAQEPLAQRTVPGVGMEHQLKVQRTRPHLSGH